MTTVTYHEPQEPNFVVGDPEKFEKARIAAGMTPRTEAIAKAAATFQVKDARGRVITLKKPSVLGQYNLIEMLGEAAKNDVYVAMVLPLIYVSSIDDDPQMQPRNKIQLNGLITLLDEDGVNAVMMGVQEHFGAPNADEANEAIKK